jgi:4-azaleucine resistance transporter AzlC
MLQVMGTFRRALAYSVPVLLGYIAIGVAFGLLLAGKGYPWRLALVMSLVMYAGAGQYLAVGLFAAGAGLWETLFMQMVVNARHIAYGLTMERRFRGAGALKFYLIFALTDETFALLSSMDQGDREESPGSRRERFRFMFYVALLNQAYWTAGSVLGALAGSFLPFNMEGIGFALSALFMVLMIEQILRARESRAFLISAAAAIPAALFLSGRFSLPAALILSLVLIPLSEKAFPPRKGSLGC